MSMDLNTIIGISAGAVTTLGAIYTFYRHIRNGIQVKKEQERRDILKIAKDEMEKIESELLEKIKKLEIELEAQKLNVSRDLEHLREIYNAEIRALGEKIEDLRKDLSDQHSAMVNLLTKLVNKN